MKILCLMIVFALVPFASSAQDPAQDPAQELSVNVKDCKRMAKNDANYRPNVDVRGKPVVPAGLQPDIKVPDEIVLDVDPNIAGRYGDLGASMTLKYDIAGGGMRLNGQVLKPSDSRAVEKACAELLGQQNPTK